LLPLVIACGSEKNVAASGTQRPCDKSSSIKGSIVTLAHITMGESIGNMLIDGTKEQQAAFTTVDVFIKADTQIFEKQGQECRSVSIAALKTGQRVFIQSTGQVAQSYPEQITATEIVVVK